MSLNRIFFDTDVIVNWLTKEIETVSGRELWTAPYKIIKHLDIGPGKWDGFIPLTTVLELRYLLRRKKRYSVKQIEEDIGKITALFEVVIPDTTDMLQAVLSNQSTLLTLLMQYIFPCVYLLNLLSLFHEIKNF